MRFQEIEETLGSKPPPSAKNRDAFWINNPKGHVHAQAWLDAGFETRNLNRQARTVVFQRVKPAMQQRLLNLQALHKDVRISLTYDAIGTIWEDRER